MDTKQDFNTTSEDNIFRRHFFRFGILGACGIVSFYIFYTLGWYDWAIIGLTTTPCCIPSYLLLIRKKTTREGNKAITHIGILALLLMAIAILIALKYPLNQQIKTALETSNEAYAPLWMFLKMFAIQFFGISSGIIPRSPRK